MELYAEVLSELVRKGDIKINLSDENLIGLLESELYITLENIKAIISDESLEDKECFYKIERIICEFERIGSSGGTRHDFG